MFSVSIAAVPMIHGYSDKLPKAFIFFFFFFFLPEASFQPAVLTTQSEFACINSSEENNILNRIHKSGTQKKKIGGFYTSDLQQHFTRSI